METVNQNQQPQSNFVAVRAWAASDLVTDAFRGLPLEHKAGVLADIVAQQGHSLTETQKKLRDARTDLNTLRKQLATHTHSPTGAAVAPLSEPIPSFLYTVNSPTNE